MKIRKPTLGKSRAFALIYGETNVGKTTSTLKSIPRPTLYYELDPKPVETALAGNIDNWEDISIHHPDDYNDMLDELMTKREKIVKKFKSMIVDPISFFMNVTIMSELAEEAGSAGIFGNERPLANSARVDMSGYGAVALLMKRLCEALGWYATQGMLVVCISLLDDKPKWDRELTAAPAFVGKDFPRDMPAYFDLIGLVKERKGKDGEELYPPMVYFESKDGDFLAKWSGRSDAKKRYKLDWMEILEGLKGGGK